MHEDPNIRAVRATIEALVEHGSRYHVDELERIYHRDLEVVMIDEDGEVAVTSRDENMAYFRSRHDDGASPLSRWTRFNHIAAGDRTGHVLVTRRMQFRDRPERLLLSIDLVREDGRWQVIREVVFIRPDDGTTSSSEAQRAERRQ